MIASAQPDGLERVASDLGLTVGEATSILGRGPLHDHAVAGLDRWLSGSLAGLAGVGLTAVAAGLVIAAVQLAAHHGGGQKRSGCAALTA